MAGGRLTPGYLADCAASAGVGGSMGCGDTKAPPEYRARRGASQGSEGSSPYCSTRGLTSLHSPNPFSFYDRQNGGGHVRGEGMELEKIKRWSSRGGGESYCLGIDCLPRILERRGS